MALPLQDSCFRSCPYRWNGGCEERRKASMGSKRGSERKANAMENSSLSETVEKTARINVPPLPSLFSSYSLLSNFLLFLRQSRRRRHSPILSFLFYALSFCVLVLSSGPHSPTHTFSRNGVIARASEGEGARGEDVKETQTRPNPIQILLARRMLLHPPSRVLMANVIPLDWKSVSMIIIEIILVDRTGNCSHWFSCTLVYITSVYILIHTVCKCTAVWQSRAIQDE